MPLFADNIRFCKYPKGTYCGVIHGVSSSPIKDYNRTTVCIKENNNIYKIISVCANKKDGSINIFFPYCKEKKAYIYQHKHKYKGGLQTIKKSQITKEFIVDKTTKLSIHISGFVQLSGKGILSGIDNSTGKPKGIGIFSSPLDKPVSSGPTFIFQCWGVSTGFELLAEKKSDTQYIILDKNKNDFTERIFKKQKFKEFNTYILEFFIFPKEANKFVYDYYGEPFIDHIIYNYIHNPGAMFAHPVLDIKNFPGVICVFPVLAETLHDNKLEYGYCLGSPGGTDCLHDKSMTGNNFHLICPRGENPDINILSKLEY